VQHQIADGPPALPLAEAPGPALRLLPAAAPTGAI